MAIFTKDIDFWIMGAFLVLFLEIKHNKPNQNMLSSLGVAIFCSIKYSEVIVLIQYPPLILKIRKI